VRILKNKDLSREKQIKLLKNMMINKNSVFILEEVRNSSFPIGEKPFLDDFLIQNSYA
jgi:hypothetical protein